MAGKKDSDLDILEQFKKYTSADLSDKRTSSAIALKRIRTALQQEDNSAIKEILINVISINLHLEKTLTDKLIQESNLVDDEGNLLPAISKDLLKLRENTLKYLKMLQSVQNKGTGKQEKSSLWDMIDE
jgi:hypothetical protein